MDNILALGFDFSIAKLGTPACIIGIILLVMSVVLIAASSKIDEAIQRKIKAKRKAEIPVEKEENKEEDSTPTEESESDEGSETQYKKATAIDNNIVNDDGEISMWRHKNGSINYFYVFKIVGLVLVIVSAIMIVVGMK